MRIGNRKLRVPQEEQAKDQIQIPHKHHRPHFRYSQSPPFPLSEITDSQQLGLEITTSLLRLASSLNISKSLGKSPHDYFLSRYPIGHPRHVATEFGDRVLPSILVDKKRKGEKLIISNTGTLRFDLVSPLSLFTMRETDL
jgi:hypothetical protein